MKNMHTSENSFGHTFKIDYTILSLFSYNNVVQASFFDLYDDVIDDFVKTYFLLLKIIVYLIQGYLDILLLLKEPGESQYQLIALKNEDYDDVYFLKVMGK